MEDLIKKEQKALVAKILAERDRAVISLDEEWAWQILKDGGIKHKPPRKQILAGLHKARIDLESAPESLKQKSRKWLEVRGMSPDRGKYS
jgi:hypothetical protein